MFNLPIYTDIIIRQDRTFALPFILRQYEYDDVAGTITDIGPWDTAGMYSRFVVAPIIADGEYGTPVIDVDTTSGEIELGIQGIPGLETSAWLWLPPETTNIDPWGMAVYEWYIETGTEKYNILEGTARLQRKSG